jgi:hypothetical protein
MTEKGRTQDLTIGGILARHVRLFGQLDEPITCDSVSHGLIQVDTTHARIHQGVYFSIGLTNLALADNASMNCLLRTGVNGVHMRPSGVAGGDARFFVFEDTTTSADGTEGFATNRNRISSFTHKLRIFEGPTITADGALLDEHLIIGGTGRTFSIGGASGLTNEWMFQKNSVYLFRLTNISGAVQPVNLHLDFYEPELASMV